MIALQDQLCPLVKELGCAPRAAIVDDEWPDHDGKEPSWWQELREVLQKNGALYSALCEKMDTLGISVETPPSDDDWNTLIEGLEIADESIQNAVDQYLAKKRMLASLYTVLEEIGFDVECHAACPDAATLGEVHLYMLDYQMNPEDTSGERTTKLIRDLMEASARTQQPPPMVVLMSKSINTADIEKWDGVASASGMLRFSYDFLNKEEFVEDSSVFSLLLLNVLQHRPIADCYCKQIRCLQAESARVSDQVMKDLFQITPPEASVFKARVERDGRTLSEELTNLYAEYLASSLRDSVVVQQKMAALEKAVSTYGGLPAPSPHRQALHKLYARLLHADPGNSAPKTPAFGDIYVDQNDKYFLVISQECDLAIRKDGKPRVDRVLAIEGKLQSSDCSDWNAGSIATRPILQPSTDLLKWLWWDMRTPVVIPYEELCEPSYTKRWKLRFQDAEDMQHRFSVGLTKVALDIMPGYVAQHQCRLFSERQKDYLPSSVVLYEIMQDQKSLVALATSEARPLFYNLKYPFLKLEAVLELGVFVTKAQFAQRLRSEKIFICKDGGELVMIKTLNGKEPEGKQPWTADSSGDSTH